MLCNNCIFNCEKLVELFSISAVFKQQLNKVSVATTCSGNYTSSHHRNACKQELRDSKGIQ